MNIPLPFWNNASPKRKRIYSIIFMFILSVSATLVGTLVQLSPTDAKAISDSVNKITADNPTYTSLVAAIFINNFFLCLLMFIPLIGSFLGLFILFSTGVGIRAILDTQIASGATSTVPSLTPTLAIIGLIGVGLTFLLEYVSYSIGVAESVWLFRRITQWRSLPLKLELKKAGILIGIVATLLITGALVETWVIGAIS